MKRHDGSDWLASDSFRKRIEGKTIGVKGLLVEVRGDWKWMKDTFRFPQHNETAGCCWLCKVVPKEIRNVDSGAQWRMNRLTHAELVLRLMQTGVPLSPLLAVPGITSQCFLIDWLHTVDQGVAADFLGGAFKMLLGHMPGDSDERRCASLFVLIQDFYRTNKVDSQLDNLTLSMFSPGKLWPGKLKCKAAECRGLICFTHQTCSTLLDVQDVLGGAVVQAAFHLAKCYDNLSQAIFVPEDMKAHARGFAAHMVSLEAAAPHFFQVKPKLHLFQELCEMLDSNPAQTWVYRDEDFGGSLALLSRRRGGAISPCVISKQVLSRFLASHAVPII